MRSLAEFSKESEKDMRKEWIGAAAGIGLVFVAAIAFMCFCRYMDSMETMQKSSDKNAGNVYYGSGFERIDYMDDRQLAERKSRSAAEQGFTVYKQLPEPVAKLMDSGIFAPAEEKVRPYREAYGDEDDEDIEILKDMQSEYESALETIGKIGTASYLDEISYIGPMRESNLECFLKWDKSTGRFADTGKIAVIENCGFTGFSDLFAEAEKRIYDLRTAESAYHMDSEEMQCMIFCQGVEFDLSCWYTDDYYRLSCQINTACYYTPEKYRNVVDGVTALGGYVPYYYKIGGKKEVLIFNRDNSVQFCNVAQYADAEAGVQDNKRIAFIFEDGKIVDYYVTMGNNKLMLDDLDKKVLDKYVSGLGKTLSEYGEQSDLDIGELFRAG